MRGLSRELSNHGHPRPAQTADTLRSRQAKPRAAVSLRCHQHQQSWSWTASISVAHPRCDRHPVASACERVRWNTLSPSCVKRSTTLVADVRAVPCVVVSFSIGGPRS